MIKTIEEYNKAKAELKDWDNSEEQGIVYDYCIQLSRDLLQYRRENNIFEVGDKIIHGRYCREIFDVVSIRGDSCSISSSEISILKIGVDMEDIRNATPQEIKAGHRL